MYFFSETRPLLGHFLKKSVFCPLEMSNTCKNFQNPKIDQKMAKYETPPLFFTWNFFYQNDSEWPKMDFKHNFKKCNILSAGPHFLQAKLNPNSEFMSLSTASLVFSKLYLWRESVRISEVVHPFQSASTTQQLKLLDWKFNFLAFVISYHNFGFIPIFEMSSR